MPKTPATVGNSADAAAARTSSPTPRAVHAVRTDDSMRRRAHQEKGSLELKESKLELENESLGEEKRSLDEELNKSLEELNRSLDESHDWVTPNGFECRSRSPTMGVPSTLTIGLLDSLMSYDELASLEWNSHEKIPTLISYQSRHARWARIERRDILTQEGQAS